MRTLTSVGAGFVTKVNPTGSALVYSTYLNGAAAHAVAVDAAGNAYVTGSALSTVVPTTPGAFQTTPAASAVFVSELNTTGTALAYSTYIGGTFGVGQGIAVDAAGSAYVTGASGPPTDFPTTPGAFQPGTNYSGQSAFVTRLIRPAPPSSTPRSWDPAVASALRWIRLATPTSRDGPTSPRSRLPWAPSSGRWSTPNRVPS
jgi:hypothetical protein